MSEYIVCPHCHNPLSQSEYVKVVRCRDCKHFEYCRFYAKDKNKPSGFCAWGVRRDA